MRFIDPRPIAASPGAGRRGEAPEPTSPERTVHARPLRCPDPGYRVTDTQEGPQR
jgi:hypothetical protein